MDRKEKILCAAVHYSDGEEYPYQPHDIESGFVIGGHSHNQIEAFLKEQLNLFQIALCAEGFLTTENRFVGRLEARAIAYDNGQCEHSEGPLSSVDLI